MRKVTVRRMRERYTYFPNNLCICIYVNIYIYIYIYMYTYMLVPNERVFMKQFFLHNFSAQCALWMFWLLAAWCSTNDYSGLLQRVGSNACYGVSDRTCCLRTQRDWIVFRWLRSDRKELNFFLWADFNTCSLQNTLTPCIWKWDVFLKCWGENMLGYVLVQETVVSVHPVYILLTSFHIVESRSILQYVLD